MIYFISCRVSSHCVFYCCNISCLRLGCSIRCWEELWGGQISRGERRAGVSSCYIKLRGWDELTCTDWKWFPQEAKLFQVAIQWTLHHFHHHVFRINGCTSTCWHRHHSMDLFSVSVWCSPDFLWNSEQVRWVALISVKQQAGVTERQQLLKVRSCFPYFLSNISENVNSE